MSCPYCPHCTPVISPDDPALKMTKADARKQRAWQKQIDAIFADRKR